jgi:hypothetical protein
MQTSDSACCTVATVCNAGCLELLAVRSSTDCRGIEPWASRPIQNVQALHILLWGYGRALILTKKELDQNYLTITLMLNDFAPHCQGL